MTASRELLVCGGGEQSGAEARERRKAHRPQDPTGVHVLDPLVDVVAAGPHLVEGGGLDPVLLPGAARHRVEADVRDDRPVEDPDVRAVGPAIDAGSTVPVAGREMVVEHVGRLHEMVVDADQDEVSGLHGTSKPDTGGKRSPAGVALP